MKKQFSFLTVIMAALLSSLATYGGSLVQYWSFDEGAGATAANAVSNGNAGALVNFADSGWNTDRPAALTHSTGSLAFNSLSNNYINGGHLGLSATGAVGEVTISFWLKPKTLGDTRLLSQLEFPSVNPSGSIQIQGVESGAGTLQVLTVVPSIRFTALSPVGAISTGVWQHVVLTWRSGYATCYISGKCVGAKANTFEFDRDTLGNALSFGIGAKFKNTYGATYNGKMDDLAIWDKALSSSQIRQLSNGRSPLLIDTPTDPATPPQPLVEYRLDGSARDKSGGFHGVVTNGPAFIEGIGNTPFHYAGNMALQFDGVNDEITLPNVADLSPRTNAWTLSVWFKAAATNQQGVLICNRQDVAPWPQMGVYVGGSVRGYVGQGRLIHILFLGAFLGKENRWEASTENVFADGNWHHVALTRGSSDFCPDVYVDGEFVSLNAIDFPAAVIDVNSTGPWRIGSNGTPGGYFKGLIDEVAMWDTDLSAGQVAWLAKNSLSTLAPKGTLIMIQ